MPFREETPSDLVGPSPEEAKGVGWGKGFSTGRADSQSLCPCPASKVLLQDCLGQMSVSPGTSPGCSLGSGSLPDSGPTSPCPGNTSLPKPNMHQNEEPIKHGVAQNHQTLGTLRCLGEDQHLILGSFSNIPRTAKEPGEAK